ncbi:glycoside hydrolase family 2 protein [uncultured Roseibium sp.]|uniref:glycoside hydrolase family 2 protein n=1 Tax=uncultured Roseibium sp. TaxID=1936171 RepID=UPI0025974D3A|nr:glycoside hydrolase family 2 protein [uncultured Roseibium sp.]
MSLALSVSGDRVTELTEGWRLLLTDANAYPDPSDLSGASGWVEASVPGTVAGTLAAAGLYDPEKPSPLHDKDAWYVVPLTVETPGKRELVFDGLATLAEIYLDGVQVAYSDNMFLQQTVEVDLSGKHELAICFRALAPHLERKGPRARWRPQLATSQGLRLVRTTLLGHMPGWCPEIHAVGPWRPISLIERSNLRAEGLRMTAGLDKAGCGVLAVDLALAGPASEVYLHCAGKKVLLSRTSTGRYQGELLLPDVAPWMPHTHGEPALHAVYIDAGGEKIDLGKTGFRTIEVDCGDDGKGFGLVVNGVPVFCRGAVWTSADLLNLSGDIESYRHLLELARDAGMNMLRIGGTMVYESRAFFELCDELGILVWQDFQFANYDYPVKDEAFVESVRTEARQQLLRSQGCPSLGVLCGGSEIYQQGAMMGLPEERWKGPLYTEILANVAAEFRADVPYVENSPCEGALPFSANEGIAHYYGVGAYQRPLEDARRAEVRFAAECLAFSNVPEAATLERHLPVKPGHDPLWKERVPRDRGAGWDFEDVRDHYLKAHYGVDPAELRYCDPERYLDLSRALTGEIMETTFAEWRRARSTCKGALVWTYQDLMPGAGWGLVDSTGVPKPAYYALKRAFRPVTVNMTDEGTNGLAVHVINDTGQSRDLVLTLTCLRDGATPVVSGEREMTLPAHSNQELAATDLFGAFFDTTYAYRFGPPAHDVTVARLTDPESEEVVAEAFHFPGGSKQDQSPANLLVELKQQNGIWELAITAERFARAVHLDLPGWIPSDNWFDVCPGVVKIVPLRPARATSDKPTGTLSSRNASRTIQIRTT